MDRCWCSFCRGPACEGDLGGVACAGPRVIAGLAQSRALFLSLSSFSHPPALTLSLSPLTTALLMPARVLARAVPASRRLARPPLSAETTGLAQS